MIKFGIVILVLLVYLSIRAIWCNATIRDIENAIFEYNIDMDHIYVGTRVSYDCIIDDWKTVYLKFWKWRTKDFMKPKEYHKLHRYLTIRKDK